MTNILIHYVNKFNYAASFYEVIHTNSPKLLSNFGFAQKTDRSHKCPVDTNYNTIVYKPITCSVQSYVTWALNHYLTGQSSEALKVFVLMALKPTIEG